jgi:hypothetical protein
MPVPSTPVLDDFNRADENPLSGGGNWVTNGGSRNRLVSNQVTGTINGTVTLDDWNVASYGPNCECYMTIATPPASSNFIRLYLRVQSPAAAGQTSYMLQWGSGGCFIFRETSHNTFTQIATVASSAFQAGDVICFRAVGPLISAWRNGVQVLSVVDANIAAAGKFIIGCRDVTIRVDDFGGGTVTPSLPVSGRRRRRSLARR